VVIVAFQQKELTDLRNLPHFRRHLDLPSHQTMNETSFRRQIHCLEAPDQVSEQV